MQTKAAKKNVKYGVEWPEGAHPLQIEFTCIRKGAPFGVPLHEHYRRAQELLWPTEKFHRWKLLQMSHLLYNRVVGVLGPASSGKTHEAALIGLTKWFVFYNEMTVLCASTSREMLEMRVWGEVKKHWQMAKDRYLWLPGVLIDSRQRIIMEGDEDDKDRARDFRNGLCGVPCKKGGEYVGLGDYVGIKNKHVLLIADESQFMPRAFVDAIANLDKNQGFQCFALGNPKDRNDALGIVCEPDSSIGGWDGVPDDEKTKTWKSRFRGGMVIQLIGMDSPNFDVPPDKPAPYPFLIKREDIEADAKFYGRDSIQFAMMDKGVMPREGVGNRILTRMLCEKFGAFGKPIWDDDKTIKILGLDAAYGSIGGDRCVLTEGHLGRIKGKQVLAIHGNPIIVPVSVKRAGLPEDQIAEFCKEYGERNGIAPERLFFDSTGRGTLMSAFARIWSPSVVPIEFGGVATDRPAPGVNIKGIQDHKDKKCRDIYRNMVTELWYSVRACVESAQLIGMTEELLSEGMMRDFQVKDGHKVQVEPKSETKKRMGRSPDLFDSLVVLVEGARRNGLAIEKLGGDGAKGKENWLDDLTKRAKSVWRSSVLHYS